MKTSKFSKVVSIVLSIMMIAAMIPVTVLAEELDARTITVENNVTFPLGKQSSSLELDYHVNLNDKLYVGDYALQDNNGEALGNFTTDENGKFSLKPGQKAVIGAKLGDSYEVVRETFTGETAYDGNIYNPIESASKTGSITDELKYYYTQSGTKKEITEAEYNEATANGENLTMKGFVDGDDLSTDYTTIKDILSVDHTYKNGTLEKVSEISITQTTEVEVIKVFGREIKVNVDYLIGACTYHGNEISAKLPKAVSTNDVVAAAVAAKIAADNPNAVVCGQENGVYPVYDAEMVTIVERVYSTETNSNAVVTFDTAVYPQLGGTASITVAYGNKLDNGVIVKNELGTDTDVNFFAIDTELSKNALNETFTVRYSTGLEDNKWLNMLGSILGNIQIPGFDLDSIRNAKITKIDVKAGELGVTYTFHGLVEGLTYAITPDIALPGYDMPEAGTSGVTSGSPIVFTVGAAGTDTVISNYVNYTAGIGREDNKEDAIVVFEKAPYVQFSKQDIKGNAVAGAEFYMVERDAIVDILKTLALYDTDWNGVYESLKDNDFNGLSWELVLDILAAFVENSGVPEDTVFTLPAILKTTSDNNGKVTFSKSCNVMASLAGIIENDTVDTSVIAKVIELLEGIGVKLPEDASSILKGAANLGNVEIETGMPTGKYILVEAKAPDGYYENPIVWTVNVASVKGEQLAANSVRIGIVYDVVHDILKDNFGTDIENFIPESVFDENDKVIAENFDQYKTEAEKYIDSLYDILDEYVTLPEKAEFTKKVMEELEKGESFASAVNNVLRSIDGIFGRTIDDRFVILNVKKRSDNDTTTPSAPSQDIAGSLENLLPNIDIKDEAVNKAVVDFIKKGAYSILDKLLKK